MEYLRTFVLTIRGREGTSTLETKLNRKPAGDRILLHFHTGVPYITVPIVGGFSQDFVVDTGKDDGLSLSPELAKRLQRLEHAVASDNETFFTAAGKAPRKCFIMRRIDIGKLRFTDVQVNESAHPGIGLGLLDHFNCVFDFPNHEAWLEPVSDERIIRLEPDASGMIVGFDPNGLASVRRVKPGYPAEKAKIEEEDEPGHTQLNGWSVQ